MPSVTKDIEELSALAGNRTQRRTLTRAHAKQVAAAEILMLQTWLKRMARPAAVALLVAGLYRNPQSRRALASVTNAVVQNIPKDMQKLLLDLRAKIGLRIKEVEPVKPTPTLGARAWEVVGAWWNRPPVALHVAAVAASHAGKAAWWASKKLAKTAWWGGGKTMKFLALMIREAGGAAPRSRNVHIHVTH